MKLLELVKKEEENRKKFVNLKQAISCCAVSYYDKDKGCGIAIYKDCVNRAKEFYQEFINTKIDDDSFLEMVKEYAIYDNDCSSKDFIEIRNSRVKV